VLVLTVNFTFVLS